MVSIDRAEAVFAIAMPEKLLDHAPLVSEQDHHVIPWECLLRGLTHNVLTGFYSGPHRVATNTEAVSILIFAVVHQVSITVPNWVLQLDKVAIISALNVPNNRHG